MHRANISLGVGYIAFQRMCIYPKKKQNKAHPLHFSYFLSFLALVSQISGHLSSSISLLRSSMAFSLHSSLPLSHLDLSSPYFHLNLLPSSLSLPSFLPLCSALQGS